MITVREVPTKSTIAVPRSRTHIMLNRMCSRLPCSHDAVKSVHHQPSWKTGNVPEAPNTISTSKLGDRKENPPPAFWSWLPDTSSVSTYTIEDKPMTTGTKP